MFLKRLWTKLFPWLPAGLWYFVIFCFSAQTGSESTELSDPLAYGLLEWRYPLLSEEGRAAMMGLLSFCVRKAAHMFIYFVLTGLLVLALRKYIRTPGRRAVAAAALCGVLAGLDEFHQTFVPGRSGLPRDVLIDLAGGCCFLLLWGICSHIRNRKNISPQSP